MWYFLETKPTILSSGLNEVKFLMETDFKQIIDFDKVWENLQTFHISRWNEM